MNADLIKREEIARLHFQRADVLPDSAQRIERERHLQEAVILGNIEKGKCTITFHADEGDRKIHTTVWAVTDKYVCLKGGVTLLIASILEVIL